MDCNNTPHLSDDELLPLTRFERRYFSLQLASIVITKLIKQERMISQENNTKVHSKFPDSPSDTHSSKQLVWSGGLPVVFSFPPWLRERQEIVEQTAGVSLFTSGWEKKKIQHNVIPDAAFAL